MDNTLTPEALVDIVRLVRLVPDPSYSCPSEVDRLRPRVDRCRSDIRDRSTTMGTDRAALISMVEAVAELAGIDPAQAVTAAEARADKTEMERQDILRHGRIFDTRGRAEPVASEKAE